MNGDPISWERQNPKPNRYNKFFSTCLFLVASVSRSLPVEPCAFACDARNGWVWWRPGSQTAHRTMKNRLFTQRHFSLSCDKATKCNKIQQKKKKNEERKERSSMFGILSCKDTVFFCFVSCALPSPWTWFVGTHNRIVQSVETQQPQTNNNDAQTEEQQEKTAHTTATKARQRNRKKNWK